MSAWVQKYRLEVQDVLLKKVLEEHEIAATACATAATAGKSRVSRN